MPFVDEGRKRVIGIIAGIIMAAISTWQTICSAGPQGSPRTDKTIAAAVQWAELIMKKVDVMVTDAEKAAMRAVK